MYIEKVVFMLVISLLLNKLELWFERQLLAGILGVAMIGLFLNYNGKYTLFSKMGRYTLSFYLFHAMMLRPFRNDLLSIYFMIRGFINTSLDQRF